VRVFILFLKFYLGTVVVVAVALYVSLFFYVDGHQDAMVFPAPTDNSRLTPLSAGMAFDDLHIPVTTSEHIHAWWIPAVRSTKNVLVFFHGNGYTLEQCVTSDAAVLHAVGANLLMIDYRGYGSSSPGNANELRTRDDARGALRYLVQTRHIPVENVTIVGRSVGTGVAAQLALENPHVHGLVLLSPYTSVMDVARERWFLRILPLSWMDARDQFDTVAKIGSIRVPILILVGSSDDYTQPWMAQQLTERANGAARLFIIQGAGHNDLLSVRRDEVVGHLSTFVESDDHEPHASQR
jgi:pimeloyl-ACP methyl ester carboxylesterase